MHRIKAETVPDVSSHHSCFCSPITGSTKPPSRQELQQSSDVHSSPRGWRLSAQWGVITAPLNPAQYDSTVIVRVVSGVPQDAERDPSLSGS